MLYIILCGKQQKIQSVLNNKYLLNDPDIYQQTTELCFGKIVESYTGVTLILNEIYSPTEKSVIFDFSKYQDCNIIGMTAISPNASIYNDEDFGIVVNQTVDRYEDGTILWRHT